MEYVFPHRQQVPYMQLDLKERAQRTGRTVGEALASGRPVRSGACSVELGLPDALTAACAAKPALSICAGRTSSPQQTPTRISVYRLLANAGLWQGRQGHAAGLSKGLRDESERVLLDGFSSDLGHDGALSSQVLVTKAQEVVDHEGCGVTKRKEIRIQQNKLRHFAALLRSNVMP